MRKHLILTAVAALAASGAALAEDLSYTYVQGDLHLSRIKAGTSEDGTGLGVNGSFGFAGNFFGFAGVDTTKYKDVDFKVTNLSLGAGGHVPLGSVDFVGGVSYESVKFSEGASDTFGGWGISAGVRAAANDKIQWNASLKYKDVDDLKSVLSLNVGGRYFFKSNMSAGLDLTHNQYDKDTFDAKENILAASFRYDFAGL